MKEEEDRSSVLLEYRWSSSVFSRALSLLSQEPRYSVGLWLTCLLLYKSLTIVVFYADTLHSTEALEKEHTDVLVGGQTNKPFMILVLSSKTDPTML